MRKYRAEVIEGGSGNSEMGIEKKAEVGMGNAEI
jgi:hypothetical protein